MRRRFGAVDGGRFLKSADHVDTVYACAGGLARWTEDDSVLRVGPDAVKERDSTCSGSTIQKSSRYWVHFANWARARRIMCCKKRCFSY
jgi:hypothetical protein